MQLAVAQTPFVVGATAQLHDGKINGQARNGIAPAGTALDTATVDSAGGVLFEGLDADTRFWVVGQDREATWQWIRVQTPESQTAHYTVDDPEDLPFLITVPAGQSEDIFVIRKGDTDVLTITKDGVLVQAQLALEPPAATGVAATDTAALQQSIDDAIDLGVPLRLLPGQTWLVTSLEITGDLTIAGDLTARIKQAPATAADLFSCTTDNVRVRFERLVLDGNCANQTDDSGHEYATINFDCDSTGATTPVRLEVVDCTFQNGRWKDIAATKSTADAAASHFYVSIENCRFLGGKESDNAGFGPAYIEGIGASTFRVLGCLFDFQGTPTYGRAGVTFTAGATLHGRLVVSDNEFREVGTAVDSGTLGCIDLYSGAMDSVVSGNQIWQPWGRGIAVKSDSDNVAITGNVVNGLNGSPTRADAQITCNRAVYGTPTGNFVIDGNALTDSGRDAISLTGDDLAVSGNYAGTVAVTGNVISGASRRAIGLINLGPTLVDGNMISCPAAADGVYASLMRSSLSISDNTVLVGAGNAIELATDNTACLVSIIGNTIPAPSARAIYVGSALGGEVAGNVIRDPGSTAIEVLNTTQSFLVTGNRVKGASNAFFVNGGSNTKLWVARNYFEGGMTGSRVKLTLDTNGDAVAWCEHHLIETFAAAAADDLRNLTGVPDGEEVSLSPWDAAHVVTVKDGTGNIKLVADFDMSTTSSTVSLRQLEGELRQVSVALN